MRLSSISLVTVILVQLTLGQYLRPKANYPCSVYESVNIEYGEELINKSISFNGDIYPPELYFTYTVNVKSNEYILNPELFGKQHRRGCICKLRPCFRKCCPRDQYYVKNECVDTNIIFEKNVTDIDGNPVGVEFDELGLVYGNSCPDGVRTFIPHTSLEGTMAILPNGSLYLPDVREDPIPHMEYCMENMKFTNEDDDSIEPNSSVVQQVYLVCGDIVDRLPGDSLRFIILSICMIFSVVFLVATLALYIILPEMRTLQGKCMMCCISGLIVAYSGLSTLQLNSVNISDTTCFTLGYIVYYGFMVCFFWLNILSFDIWWSFSGYEICTSRTIDDNLKFIFYSIYAWSGSFIIFAITLGMHHHPNLHVDDKPGIGLNHCWLQDATVFRYFYGPILCLILFNIFFFIASSIKVCRITRKLSLDEHHRFFLIFKMFLIMGVTWSFEVLSWFLGGSQWLWIVTDLFNVLQGILIFFVLILDPKVHRLLKRRFHCGSNPAEISRAVLYNRSGNDEEVRTEELTDNVSSN